MTLSQGFLRHRVDQFQFFIKIIGNSVKQDRRFANPGHLDLFFQPLKFLRRVQFADEGKRLIRRCLKVKDALKLAQEAKKSIT